MPTLYLLEVTQLRTKAVDGLISLIFKKSEKHHISSSRDDVRGAISTKFCMAIEVVSAIILAPNVFGPIHSFAARGVENLAENAPIVVNY